MWLVGCQTYNANIASISVVSSVLERQHMAEYQAYLKVGSLSIKVRAIVGEFRVGYELVIVR